MKEPKKHPGVNYVPSKDYAPNPEVLNMRPPAKRTERKVPVTYRTILRTEWFRTFSFLERIKILFGSNLVVLIGIATQHRPGEYQPLIVGRVSYAKNATTHMESVVANMLEERLPETDEVRQSLSSQNLEEKKK